jgi:hypothetical protein
MVTMGILPYQGKIPMVEAGIEPVITKSLAPVFLFFSNTNSEISKRIMRTCLINLVTVCSHNVYISASIQSQNFFFTNFLVHTAS